jgi:hypothetical protein
MRQHARLLLVAAAIGSTSIDAPAFQLSPIGTKAERRQAGRSELRIRAEMLVGASALHMFSNPVHETITQLTYDCGLNWTDCADPDLEYAGAYVIAGIRWNDDPVFMLKATEGKELGCRVQDTVSFITQTKCWLGLFKDAEKKAAEDPQHFLRPGTGTYMSRSHFGDLQFLHAMASVDGEQAAETKRKLLMWAEFTWGVAVGTYRLATPLREIAIPGWLNHFANGQNVQDLFTQGRPWLRPHIKQVVFGSLLHLVQDSFAEGHVMRADPVSGVQCAGDRHRQFGRIVEFHSYAKQDHAKHAAADSANRAQHHIALHNPDVLDAGKTLREFFDRDAPWSQVEAYLSECVFPLADREALAGPGDRFRAE